MRLPSSEPPPFISAAPRVRLIKAFATPFANVIATARTCYSSQGIVEDSQIGGEAERIALGLYQAGHHTTFQHAHFQFAIENVSRQCVWGFLHAHPFYNSEQASQRYARIREDACAIPPLQGEALAIYQSAVARAVEYYRRLGQELRPLVEREFFQRFRRSERMEKSHASAIGKKSQEIARYALPIGWHTALYHTVSGLTLLRYWRACRLGDSPAEQEIVARQMIEALLRHDPGFESLPTEPLPPAPAPLSESANSAAARREFVAEFDASMEGHVSKLIDWSERAEALLAESVREILCASPASLSDDQAIALALDPACNPLLGDSLNLATLDKATRALAHPRYIFRKKLSHSADSQDQRHRMTPGSRPYLAPSLRGGPDYIVPALILEDSAIERLYRQAVESAWEAIERLLDRGTSPEHALYLLPNAVAIRFTESADLMSLRHKHAMRLCYNAQEEIWRASLDEARQIQAIHPRIGAWLLPPCGQRLAAGAKPICPEGSRFCGVRVWTMKLEDYKRLI